MRNCCVVDVNVPMSANERNTHADCDCILFCVRRLRELVTSGCVVIDSGGEVLKEYRRHLAAKGAPGVGDMFFAWLWNNYGNPECVRWAVIHAIPDRRKYTEFPLDENLSGFDLSDRKYVAVSLACEDRPPILNATDSDWKNFEIPLGQHGVCVEQLCPHMLK